MNILAIECTHAALSVAVMKTGIVTEIKSADWRKAAEALVPLIEEVMEAGRLKQQDLDCIAVSSGPGSFTSLRIGIAVAKGIAYGLGIPLIPVPTMPAMAASLQADIGGVVMVVIQARKGEYYYASYISEDLFSGVWHDEILRGSANDVAAAVQQGTLVVGRQLDELVPILAAACTVYKEADFFSARALFASAERRYTGTDAAGIDKVHPDYRQMFIPHVG
ncbi:MAG: tRNA (adenosine(37)-N6)-threonylcarbamoyltransferase complex dimerization subunit type 1 TsaB [Chlorobiales bacterium]|nr:tRNA (adenosine(37)-N6)-threonylcarbamoyltransferase complex dimerization subunit type 1 TsaB [Chlorobiales bacterium]